MNQASAVAKVAKSGKAEAGAAAGPPLFGLFLKLENRKCVVVGGGAVAEEKIGSLIEAGAQVTVLALKASDQITRWAQEGRLVLWKRAFETSDVEGAFLVVSATDSSRLNAEVYAEAEARGILCNAVDDPAHCHFFYPSVVRRGPLQIAISTTGYSPALAQRLRRELENQYGPEYAAWVRHLGAVRIRLFQDATLTAERRREMLHELASAAALRAYLDESREKRP